MSDEKSQIRIKFLLKRNKLYNKKIKFPFNDILKLIKKVFENKKISLAGYYPINFEVDVLNFLSKISKEGINTALPIITKNSGMIFKSWNSSQTMYLNKYGIPEPNKMNKALKPDVILVPLVAYDQSLNRLGYGAGYYDRALKKLSLQKKILSIGIAFSFQKYSKIPINETDHPLDYILTENKIIYKKQK